MEPLGILTVAFMVWFFMKLMDRQDRNQRWPCAICKKPIRYIPDKGMVHVGTGKAWEPYSMEYWREHFEEPAHRREPGAGQRLAEAEMPHPAITGYEGG